MKRPIMQKIESLEGQLMELPYPDFSEWNPIQQQIQFVIPKYHPNMPIQGGFHIAYHYGECFYVLDFINFFENFWNIYGMCLEINLFDLIDKKFIDWVEVMQFEEMCEEISIDFDKKFKSFFFK